MTEWTQQAHVFADHAVSGVLGAVTSLHFDPFAELLWAGSESGQLSSHTNTLPTLPRYTSLAAHGTPTHRQGVRGILSDDKYVMSVSERSVCASQRNGLNRWMLDLAKKAPGFLLAGVCASPQSSSSDIIVGGSTTSAAPVSPDPNPGDALLAVHANSGRIVRRAPSNAAVTQVRKGQKYVCVGTEHGAIQLHDPRSLRSEHKLSAHHGGLIDIQTDGHMIYSIGWTLRQGRRVAEPFIKAHDLRSMHTLVPIPLTVPGGPAHLAVHPKKSSILAVATPQSHFQLVDIQQPGLGQFYTLGSSAYITALTFSSSADALAFGESDGTVRLWTSNHTHPHPPASVRFNAYTTAPVTGPDYAPPPPVIEWSDDTPLSCIGMPHYTTPLLSRIEYDSLWTDASPLFTMHKHVNEHALEHARHVQGVTFARVPLHLRGTRNRLVPSDHVLSRFDRHGKLTPAARTQMMQGRRSGLARRVDVPMAGLFSDLSTVAAPEPPHSDGSSQLDVQSDARSGRHLRTSGSDHADSMPHDYRYLTIQYSRFGVEDFDFASYNQTPYSGLETNISAAYANSYFQALHYTKPFRAFAKRHIMMPCTADDCLLCEAGFLFRMLEDARGTNCQASNVLRVLTRTPQVAVLGLLDDEVANMSYAHMVQTLNGFFLDQASQRALRTGASMSLSSTMFTLCANPCAWSMMTYSTCGECGHTTVHPHLSHVVDLLYPPGRPSPLRNSGSGTGTGTSTSTSTSTIGGMNIGGIPSTTKYPASGHASTVAPGGTHDFASLVSASILRETLSKTPCRQCRSPFSHHRSWRAMASTDALPSVLCINASALHAEQLTHWVEPTSSGRTFVPPRLVMYVDEMGLVHVQSDWEDELLESRSQDDKEALRSNAACYMLRAMVIQAQGRFDAPHLCTLVRSPNDDEPNAWYLFNDFLVRPIDAEDALRFGETWKVPAILMWERTDAAAQSHAAHLAELGSHLQLDTSLLLHDVHMSQHRDASLCRHRVLDKTELPQPGTLVAIDAEFVALAHEELDVFSDGTRTLLQPSRLALARVSVLRGEGPRQGEPFLDDHIHTTERVVDYLTQFSGIHADDLDPARTRKTLVSHKTAYKKLRMLTDLGCRFIGHGLAKDFRIINIYVPPHQVIDTVQLYHSAAHPRNLSLRFLSWFLLKRDIQQGLKIRTESAEQSHEGHDSIEDALAALQLYQKYEEFVRDGRLEDMLEDLYEIGPRVNWRPPEKT